MLATQLLLKARIANKEDSMRIKSDLKKLKRCLEACRSIVMVKDDIINKNKIPDWPDYGMYKHVHCRKISKSLNFLQII